MALTAALVWPATCTGWLSVVLIAVPAWVDTGKVGTGMALAEALAVVAAARTETD